MIDPVALLQELIRFDTTNPPGNEEACVAHIEALLREHGIESERYEKTPGQAEPDRAARRARTSGPPLVLYGHVDVVTTVGQQWTRAAVRGEHRRRLRLGPRRARHEERRRDVRRRVRRGARGRLARRRCCSLILSDEENGGDEGAMFIADEHPDALGGAKHALGEFGGVTQWIGGRRFYPIQVAEKQMCWLRAHVRGTGGHGALGVKGGAMRKLGDMLRTLDRRQPPVHIIPLVREWFEQMAAELPRPQALLLRRLLDPRTADLAARALGPRGRQLSRVIRNTVSPTIVRGGDKINVIPSEIELQLDGRHPARLHAGRPDRASCTTLVGNDVEFEVIRHDPGPPEPDL